LLFADYYEELSSKARTKNKMLQTQLDKIHDEMMRYKVGRVIEWLQQVRNAWNKE